MDGLDYFGAEEVGFDYGQLFQAAGGLLQGGASILEQQQAEGKQTAEAKTKLEAVIAADAAASNAATRADVSAQLKSKSAAADASAATKAIAAQDAAGADLPPEIAQKRIDAANKMLATVTKNSRAKPKDGYQAALVKAWTATVNKARNVDITSRDVAKSDKMPTDSWWTRRVLGPVPGIGVVVGGVAVAGVLGLVVKTIFFRRP